jgi:hypothetical protein
MNRSSSLAFRIAVYFSTLVAALLATIIVITQFILRNELGGFTRDENLAIAEARAHQIGEMLDMIAWQARMIAERPDMQAVGTDRDTAFKAIPSLKGKLSPEAVGCFISDAAGTYLSVERKGGSIADRDYFGKIVNGAEAGWIGTPVVSKSLGIPIVVVAAAVKDDAGPPWDSSVSRWPWRTWPRSSRESGWANLAMAGSSIRTASCWPIPTRRQ